MTKQTSTTNSSSPLHQIGVLNEKPLHAALKAWYAGENDQVEVKVDGFIIDRLLSVVERHLFQTPADFAPLIPSNLADRFTTAHLAAALGKPRALARKMVYCLREMGLIVAVGKRGRFILYTRSTEAPSF